MPDIAFLDLFQGIATLVQAEPTILIGRIAAAPEPRHAGETAITSFTLVTDRPKLVDGKTVKNEAGYAETLAEFHRVTAFNGLGTSVANEAWFRQALATRSGSDFAVADIAVNRELGSSTVATYAAAIRAGGEVDGKPVGVLGIFFDWKPQARDHQIGRAHV